MHSLWVAIVELTIGKVQSEELTTAESLVTVVEHLHAMDGNEGRHSQRVMLIAVVKDLVQVRVILANTPEPEQMAQKGRGEQMHLISLSTRLSSDVDSLNVDDDDMAQAVEAAISEAEDTAAQVVKYLADVDNLVYDEGKESLASALSGLAKLVGEGKNVLNVWVHGLCSDPTWEQLRTHALKSLLKADYASQVSHSLREVQEARR